MLRIRTLGTVEVRDARGTLLEDLLAAPKRLGLLTYVALAGESGARRDELVSVFWPEVDAMHARGTLRQTLRLLRMDVGDGVIRCSGAAVAVEAVWCDAADLSRTGEDVEVVLKLYRGPFLAALHVPNAGQQFEDWRAQRAERLRRQAARTLRSAARAAERAGEVDRAEHLWQRLRVVSPWNESAIRGLMRCLGRAGSPGEALGVYHSFVGALRQQLDVGPSRRTVELARRLQGRSLARAGIQASGEKAAPWPEANAPSTG